MKKKNFIFIVLMLCIIMSLCGCSEFGSRVQSLKGSISGNTYQCEFYSNQGDKFMTVEGQRIDIEPNVVREYVYTNDGWGYTKTLSSVVTITVDGHQIENCGSTVLFVEKGLNPDVDFKSESVESISSESDNVLDYTAIANIVNKFKNSFGKSVVVVIQSQLGNPICAYSGEKVYWEVCEDLPKTTKLYIDGRALYIHRANFQLIDKELLK